VNAEYVCFDSSLLSHICDGTTGSTQFAIRFGNLQIYHQAGSIAKANIEARDSLDFDCVVVTAIEAPRNE